MKNNVDLQINSLVLAAQLGVRQLTSSMLRCVRWLGQSFIPIVPLCLILSACGFHLRGAIDMPHWLNHVAVIIEQAQRDLGPSVVASLQSYKITIDTSPATAQYWLIVQHDNLQKQIASISSSTTPRQYELSYTVQFTLMYAKGQEIMPPSTIKITRQATMNNDRILGSNQEEALLIHEMMREAATQMMNRISKMPAPTSSSM